jgi:hypothetical protein
LSGFCDRPSPKRTAWPREGLHRADQLARLAPYRFERVYGGWWRRVVRTDGKAAVARSAERYLRFALGEQGPAQPGELG